MRLLEIGSDTVTLELTPEDAYLLARACRCAGLELGGSCALPDDTTGDMTAAASAVGLDVFAGSQHFDALSALFDAAALAAVAARHVTRDVRDLLQLSNLREGKGQLLDFSVPKRDDTPSSAA